MFLTPICQPTATLLPICHKEAGKVQLTKAAVRLADLLNHIAWK
jgi:hypothetical protein